MKKILLSKSLWFRLLALAALTAVAAYFVDLKELWNQLRGLPWWLWVVMISLEWLFYLIESLRVFWLAKKQYPLSGVLRSRLVSALMSNVLPGLGMGDLVRVFMLDSYRPGHKVYVALLTLAGRIYGLMSLGLMFILPAVMGYSVFASFDFNQAMLAVLICLAVMVFPLVFQLRWLRRNYLRIYPKLRHKLLRSTVRVIYMCFTTFGNFRAWWMATLTSAMTTLIVVFQFWLVGWGMGESIDFVIWMIAVPLVNIAAFLPIGFGAVGSQDAGLMMASQVLSKPVTSFVAISVFIHLSRIIGTLPGLFYYDEIARIKQSMVRKA